jgi:hypothetical protein
MQIPKILHLIEPSEQVFQNWKDYLPDWECYEWTLEQCSLFVQKFYPEFFSVYQSYTHTDQKIRASWVFLLHRYGGVAIDKHMIPKKRISSLFYTPHSFYTIEKKMIASPPKSRLLENWMDFLSHSKGSFWMKLQGTLVDKTTWMEHKEAGVKVIPERIWSTVFFYYKPVSFFKLLGWKPIMLAIVSCIVSYYFFRKKVVKTSHLSTPTPVPEKVSAPLSPLPIHQEDSVYKYLGKPSAFSFQKDSQYIQDWDSDALSEITLSEDTLSMSRISSLSSLYSLPDEITVNARPSASIVLEE